MNEDIKLISCGELYGFKSLGKAHQWSIVFSIDSIAPTLTATDFKRPIKILIENNSEK